MCVCRDLEKASGVTLKKVASAKAQVADVDKEVAEVSEKLGQVRHPIPSVPTRVHAGGVALCCRVCAGPDPLRSYS